MLNQYVFRLINSNILAGPEKQYNFKYIKKKNLYRFVIICNRYKIIDVSKPKKKNCLGHLDFKNYFVSSELINKMGSNEW